METKTLTEQQNVVYHYTSIDTMMKIVESGEMWATSTQYLNDISELNFFVRGVRDRLPTYIFEKNIPKEDQSIFSVAQRKKEHDPGFVGRPFVTSFSKLADSLPQWRAYCHEGNGVSVGFRTDCIARAKPVPALPPLGFYSVHKAPTVSFSEVQYVQPNDPSAFDTVISVAFDLAMGRLGPLFPKPATAELAANIFDVTVNVVAARMKHASFASEEESRVVVDAPYHARSFVQFRSLRSTLLPYVRLSIPRSVEGHSERVDADDPTIALSGRWQFIDRVVIGPTPNKRLTRQAVEAFLRRHNLHVEVVSSDIPYRHWLK